MKKCKNRPSVETLESRLFLSTARVALISDYGTLNVSEGHVADMVKSWNAAAPLDAILTSGDNDQYAGNDYVNRVGAYYDEFIFGRGSATQRFLPSPGNHDWNSTVGLANYTSFFTIPDSSSGNERYYSYTIGPVEFFMLDSDSREPDGASIASTQAQWLQTQMPNSTASWQVVMFHHTAYSSADSHGGTIEMQWPFQSWGADLVVSGHNHVYERVNVDGLRFITNGVGGYDGLDSFGTTIAGSEVRHNAENGAILMEVTDTTLNYQFINTAGQVIDTFGMTNIPMPRLAISATQDAAEGAVPGRFTITRSVITSGELTVNYSVGGTASADDYQPVSGSVTFVDGQTAATIEITTIDDTLGEGDETLTLTLASDPAYQLTGGSATIIIADDDVQTTAFQQGIDTNLLESTPATNCAAASSLTVDTDEPSGSAKAAQALLRFTDLFGSFAGQIPFGSTILSAQLQLYVNDTGNRVNVHRMLNGWTDTDTWSSVVGGIQADGVEAAFAADLFFTPSTVGLYTLDVTAALSAWAASPSGNFGWALLPTGGDGVDVDSFEGTIKPRLVVDYAAPANLPTVSIAVAANGAEPAANGSFIVTRSGASTDLVVHYAIGGTAANGGDYQELSGFVTIAAGQASAVIDLIPVDDALPEPDETVTLAILNDADYIIGASTATLAIGDDDLKTAAFAQATDTNLLQRTPDTSYASAVSLTVLTDKPRTAKTAQALLRFDGLFGSGAGQIPEGSTVLSATLQLNVTDGGREVRLHRMLRTWSDAATWNSMGNGIDADGIEAILAADASFTAAAAGLQFIDVASSLQAWANDPASAFGWVLISAGTDGVALESAEGAITPRLVVEYVAAAPRPLVSIEATANAAYETGGDGIFTVTRSGDLSADLTVRYEVSGSATASQDYATLTGLVTIPQGLDSVTFSVIPIDDPNYETDETVVVSLSADPAYAIGASASATVTIVSDEVASAVPAAPTELKGTAVAGGRVDLKWIDNATNETGYIIEWSVDGINWLTMAAPADTISGSVTGLNKSTFYYFRVKAENAFGASDYSVVLKIRTASK